MVMQGDKQMARTTKQTKKPATPGFAIEIKNDTELGLYTATRMASPNSATPGFAIESKKHPEWGRAILVAVYAAGGYRPIGVRSTSARRARSRKATGATTPAPPSRSTSCGRRVWKATTSGWRPRSAFEERNRRHRAPPSTRRQDNDVYDRSRQQHHSPRRGARRAGHPGRFCQAEGTQQDRSEEHTSELQSLRHLVCRLLL